MIAWTHLAAHQRRLILIALAFVVSAATSALATVMLLSQRSIVTRQLARTGADQARYAARLIGDVFDGYAATVRSVVFQGVTVQDADPEPSADLMLRRLKEATAVPGLLDSLTGTFHYVPGRGFTQTAGAMTRVDMQAWVGDSIGVRIAAGMQTPLDVNVSRTWGSIVLGAWLVPRGRTPHQGIDGSTFIRSVSAPRLVEYILRTVPLLPPSVVGTTWYRGLPVEHQAEFGVTIVDRGSRRVLARHAGSSATNVPTYTGTYAVAHGTHGQEITVTIPRATLDKSLLPELKGAVSPTLPLTLGVFSGVLALCALWGMLLELSDANDRRIFLSKLAHEFRTPLSSIRAYAESLSRGTYQSPEAARKATDAIGRGVSHLTRLVENVLMHSRSQVAGWRIYPQSVDLSGTVHAAIDAFDSAPQQTASIRREITPDIHVVVDPFAVRQMVSNLVDNALRHSALTSMIRVSLDRAPNGSVVLRVADDGGGFPAGVVGRIGAPFVHDANRTSPAPGAGIGLSIVSELAREHGAAVDARNDERGAVVTITFPAAGLYGG